MKSIDLIYLEKCTKTIERSVGLGDISSWKQRDYEKLCELILKKTDVSLSLTTIKRILNNNINLMLHKATLNALAQFIGFTDWFDFIQNSSEITDTFNRKSENINKKEHLNSKDYWWVKMNKSIFAISFLALLLFIAGFLLLGKKLTTGKQADNSKSWNTVLSFMDIDTLSGKKFRGLALTPPMGWNSWNTFGLKINESLIKAIADKLVESGMRKAGYRYLIIDEGWQSASRDKRGNLVADSVKFPGGMKALADYIHSKKLQFGIYSCTGNKSWFGKPGGRGHEFQDARTFASWGVDYLKYDWSSDSSTNAVETYKIMRDAIYAAKRPMVYSICEWGIHYPWQWGKNVGHLWRNSRDISDCFDCKETYSTGWKNILDHQVGLEKYAGPDHWNDPDMLEVGNPGLSLKESKAHFSMWCMLAAPLIAGNDLRTMPEEIRQILTNKEAIAINQDSLGKQAIRYSNLDGKEIWIKELSKGNWAFCFLNTGKSIINMPVNWHDFSMLVKGYTIRDIWRSEDKGTTKTSMKIYLNSNDALFLKLTSIP